MAENPFLFQHLPTRSHCRKGMYSTQGVQKNALIRDQIHPKFAVITGKKFVWLNKIRNE